MQSEDAEPQQPEEVQARVAALKGSIAADWYEPQTFIPWHELADQLGAMEAGIASLQRLTDKGPVPAESLAALLQETESVLDVLLSIFVAPRGAGFRDGRLLPTEPPRSSEELRTLAGLAVDLGLNELLSPGTDVRSIVRASLVAIDARRRGFRRGYELEQAVASVISHSIREVQTSEGLSINRVPRSARLELPARLDEVLAIDGRPFVAIQSVFQVSSGGRQQRDLSTTYPLLQQTLRELGISLVLIVDGDGIRRTPDRVLESLLNSVSACMTLRQARAGNLARAIVMAADFEPPTVPLQTLIETQLAQEGRISADLLPTSRDASLQTLARFVDQRPELALQLDVTARELRWPAVYSYKKGESLSPAEILAASLGLEDIAVTQVGRLSLLEGRLQPDRILPEEFFIGLLDLPIDSDAVRQTSIAARNGGAKLAVLVATDAATWRQSSEAGALRNELATSVVALDVDEVPLVIGAKQPRQALVKYVLEQADLTKANPYSQHGVTRREMFFGREPELAEIRASLETNSIALLGGRRIGKTSLLTRTIGALESERWHPTMVDCQAVGDWEGFQQLMSRHGLTLGSNPSAAAVTDLVDQLGAQAGPGRPVLILDEVDSLLRWDMSNSVDGVSEVIFRSFRAASQEDRIRFVFSGERLISERMGDPSSPHWNFCRPLVLRQLSQEASADLFERPLAELGVTAEDPREVRRLAWEHSQGHPQILQYLGSSIVRRLNQKPPQDRGLLTVQDVVAITSTSEYANHYVSTYWGQSTALEKAITALLAIGVTTPNAIVERLRPKAAHEEDLRPGLKMLELYGIVDGLEPPYSFRAKWFAEALGRMGDIAAMILELKGES